MSKIFGFQKMRITRWDLSLSFSKGYIRYSNFSSSFRICSKKLEKPLFKHKKWPFLGQFWAIFGPFLAIVCVSAVSTPQHGQNITILFVRCEVHSNTKLLGYGKHMVNVWFFWDIRTLKWPLKGPKMAIFEPLWTPVRLSTAQFQLF